MGLWAQLDGFVGCFVFVIPGTADVLPVTFTGSYAKLGHFNLWLFPHSGYVPVIAEAKPAYQVERYPLCGASPFLPAIPCVSCICDPRAGDDQSSRFTIIVAESIIDFFATKPKKKALQKSADSFCACLKLAGLHSKDHVIPL